ncbi:DUF6228 family protein [Dyella sp.]|uniref:DUF6228 family protein n=1 Tax=Dyella sp. TaxID=1869338 RepID=UPI0039C8562B
MIEFEIKDVESSAYLRFEGKITQGQVAYDGCSFALKLHSTNVSATTHAYDCQFNKWTRFFEELASNSGGWNGVTDCESLEGDLRLEATSDSLGHIRLRIRLRNVDPRTMWSAETSITLEAGQLDTLAKQAKAYFGC